MAIIDSFHTIMVPGLCCSARLFEPVVSDVWAHGPVTVADTRRDTTFPGMVSRLLADAPERFALLGYSMGGYIALEVVRQAPERVRGLALISTSADPDAAKGTSDRLRQLELVRRGRFDQLIEAAFWRLTAPVNRHREDLATAWAQMAHEVGPEAFANQLLATIARGDARPALEMIDCPTAVIHGADDQLLGADHARATAAAIPRAMLSVIAAAGHMLPQEQPEALRGALRAWLDAVGETEPDSGAR